MFLIYLQLLPAIRPLLLLLQPLPPQPGSPPSTEGVEGTTPTPATTTAAAAPATAATIAAAAATTTATAASAAAPAPGPGPATAAAITLPSRTATYARGNRVMTLTMVNIVAAPAAPAPLLPGPPPPPAGTPRAQWDRPAPYKRATDEEWGTFFFIELPPAAWFTGRSEAAPAIVPGLPPWIGSWLSGPSSTRASSCLGLAGSLYPTRIGLCPCNYREAISTSRYIHGVLVAPCVFFAIRSYLISYFSDFADTLL
ncbi:uncharacterized protein BP01DRAFT_369156 [Aspergillus saccharolyticus JOP 1030-1]|uniref:Uncharacterized protein n=1 Tax=Aspergillus saccharolyticus JOP 1030-1 TaxID=1450539 RepID=A0A318Z2H2_9EURO|nr:hypothetical protein BP01DRAFT_369156 [Aspergillus saccharolyticus JOP 1030-1]PYH41256.1 hypothetical protein BP01DRAFT_369156 [Aspergillus saccharolyticus JOP 1030-1]